MKLNKLIMSLGTFGLIFTSCEKNDEVLQQNINSENSREETVKTSEMEVEEFIYSGMNEIYLYKANVAELDDAYFSGNSERIEFLESFNSPEDLFEGLKSSADRFSFMTDDYHALEESFKGISSTVHGMKFGLGRISGSNRVFAYLQYVLPETPAGDAGLTRGTIFTKVNGQAMTTSNYESLLDSDSFTINVGSIVNGSIRMTDDIVSLDKSSYTSNPVYVAKTLEIESKKVGYLMYNSFIGDFDDELNNAFGEFKADGVNNLILDLRYNGGGSVESAVDLASMITGQFEGEIFMKEQWNEEYQDYYEAENPERLINRFDPQIRTQKPINSLQLSKVYVLTSERSASASELVINGLEPYIDVIQVGEATTGKFQASVTLYDSEGFTKEGASENHTYAIQPLVFKSANAAGKSDYINGLAPDVRISEDLDNLGTLGDVSEPLLQAALNHLLGKAQETKSPAGRKSAENFSIIGENGMDAPNYQRMYIDEVPAALERK